MQWLRLSVLRWPWRVKALGPKPWPNWTPVVMEPISPQCTTENSKDCFAKTALFRQSVNDFKHKKSFMLHITFAHAEDNNGVLPPTHVRWPVPVGSPCITPILLPQNYCQWLDTEMQGHTSWVLFLVTSQLSYLIYLELWIWSAGPYPFEQAPPPRL